MLCYIVIRNVTSLNCHFSGTVDSESRVIIVIYVAMYNVTITTLIIQATGPKREYPDRGGATGKYD